jgi:hypothetical protein
MSRLQYFDLSITAPRRLAMMRADFNAHSVKYPNCPESAKPLHWKNVRGTTLGAFRDYFGTASIGWNPGPRGARIPVLTSFHADRLPVRDIRFADEVLPSAIEHNGWFADSEGSGDQGVIRGIVARLSHGRFLSGYHWTDNGEHVLFIGQVFESEDDAARDADHKAESYAELCRDDDEKYRAVSDAEALVESKESDLCTAWEDYRAAWGAYLQNPRHAAAAIRARDWVRELITDLRAFRKELTEARAAYERG